MPNTKFIAVKSTTAQNSYNENLIFCSLIPINVKILSSLLLKSLKKNLIKPFGSELQFGLKISSS